MFNVQKRTDRAHGYGRICPAPGYNRTARRLKRTHALGLGRRPRTVSHTSSCCTVVLVRAKPLTTELCLPSVWAARLAENDHDRPAIGVVDICSLSFVSCPLERHSLAPWLLCFAHGAQVYLGMGSPALSLKV
jgi:hypothetical protein